MSAKVQVSRDFIDGVKLLLEELKDHNLDSPIRILCQALEAELSAKLEALEKRQAFTEYKTSTQSTQDREARRQAYLNQAGISKNFRSPKETAHSP